MRILAWISTQGKAIDSKAELKALRDIASRTGVTVTDYVDRPLGDLGSLLAVDKPDIFHFIGHGNSSGDLILSDAAGLAHPVAAADLATTLQAVDGGGVKGVVLNACHSGKGAHALAPRGGWVVAMDATIRDDAAIEFTSAFYGALAVGQSPYAAARAARAYLAAAGFPQQDHVARLLPGDGYGYYKSTAPRADERNRDALEHVATVFNRSAFRTPAIQEASYDQLMEALEHTTLALGTGQMVTRATPTAPFSTIPPHLLHAPALRSLSGKIFGMLDQARGVLVRLDAASRASAPPGMPYDYVYASLVSTGQVADADALMSLMDQVDAIRNKILKSVNRALQDEGIPPLPGIPKSSDLMRCEPRT